LDSFNTDFSYLLLEIVELKLEHLLEGDGLEVDLTNLLELASLLNNSVPMPFLNGRVTELLNEGQRSLKATDSRLQFLERRVPGDRRNVLLELADSRFLNVSFFLKDGSFELIPGNHRPLFDLVVVSLVDVIDLGVELVELLHLDHGGVPGDRQVE